MGETQMMASQQMEAVSLAIAHCLGGSSSDNSKAPETFGQLQAGLAGIMGGR
jgi:hypothetical protein